MFKLRSKVFTKRSKARQPVKPNALARFTADEAGTSVSDFTDEPADEEPVDEAPRQPIGECYVYAAEWLCLPWSSPLGEEAGELPKNAKLVHGYPTLQTEPYAKYGHAWIEVGNKVYDPTHKPVVKMPKEAYYALGQIDPKECVSYSKAQAKWKLASTGIYGPWERIPADAQFA